MSSPSDENPEPSSPADHDAPTTSSVGDSSGAETAPAAVDVKAAPAKWLTPDSRKRRLLVAAIVYVLTIVVFAIAAGPDRLATHTPFNHFAHLANAWLHGRNDLAGGAPAYAQGNDFAELNGKTFISFPPFPAVLMLPMVAAAGSPENFRDGQFVLWMAGVGPAVLFLVLEKLRRTKRSDRTERENLLLTFLFAFGSVYFFTAVQGTVWFAAHVIGVGALACFILFSLDAERPWLAGLALACAWTTRVTMLLAGIFFVLEALRVACKEAPSDDGPILDRAKTLLGQVQKDRVMRLLIPFAIPVLVSFAIAAAYNNARFGDASPFAFGHEYLTVVWKTRITRWGLFGYHYLAKNLGCMLTVLPWLPPKGPPNLGGALFKINEHGLALWFTTPIYFWLFRPKRGQNLAVFCIVAALLPMSANLLYQNSGWRQFGYRFSNDYSLFFFVLLALGGRSLEHTAFRAAAAWSVVWNLFGAATFDKARYDAYYFREGSQTVLYQAD